MGKLFNIAMGLAATGVVVQLIAPTQPAKPTVVATQPARNEATTVTPSAPKTAVVSQQVMTAPVVEAVPQTPTKISAELEKSMAKVSQCVASGKNCRLHIVGIFSGEPACQFSVMPGTWKSFSDTDKEAAGEVAKLYLSWMRQSPYAVVESEKDGAGIPSRAPAFQAAGRQLAKVTHCRVSISEGRDKHGWVGWLGEVLPSPVFGG